MTGMIVGICRFSFLGLGDWVAWRGDRSTSPDRLEAVAARLYAEDRMIRRFAAFEAVFLPSVTAQADPDMRILILASLRMPEPWRSRLTALCISDPRLRIIWSDIPDSGAALSPHLAALHEESGGRLWQFRLDDDDALAGDFIPTLRSHMARMEGFDNAAITLSQGLYLCLYPGQPLTMCLYRTPFLGAGLAVRVSRPGQSIFRFGHYSLRDRMSHIVDHQTLGALVLRWPSDSQPLQMDRLPAGVQALRPRRGRALLAQHFPALRLDALQALHPGPG